MCWDLGHIVEVKLQRISGKTNHNGQVEKRIATDKWKKESQRTSGKTNRNGQVEKRIATEKWQNESQPNFNFKFYGQIINELVQFSNLPVKLEVKI